MESGRFLLDSVILLQWHTESHGVWSRPLPEKPTAITGGPNGIPPNNLQKMVARWPFDRQMQPLLICRRASVETPGCTDRRIGQEKRTDVGYTKRQGSRNASQALLS